MNLYPGGGTMSLWALGPLPPPMAAPPLGVVGRSKPELPTGTPPLPPGTPPPMPIPTPRPAILELESLQMLVRHAPKLLRHAT
mmetsp:Transcript_8913/g.16002  ORF Transcript_8913/g.16002 Transcript_8913/m.16002 type:complete len:83 (+) Transcript_8913:412-660(+)